MKGSVIVAATAGYSRKRAVTPINDFAQINRRGKSITQMNTLRFHYQLKRSNMFSLAMRGIKFFGYLFVTLLLLLLVLNFQLVHDGKGRFKVAEKSKWAFTETFVTRTNTPVKLKNRESQINTVFNKTDFNAFGTTNSSPAKVQRTEDSVPNGASLSASMECKGNRTILSEAVNSYNQTHRNSPMRDLEIFSLLSEGYINELSDCPMGGQYTLNHDNRTNTTRISCSSHK